MEQEVSTSPVIIDPRALNLIKDKMRRRFHDGPIPEISVLAIEALFDYVAERGGRPGFELRLNSPTGSESR